MGACNACLAVQPIILTSTTLHASRGVSKATEVSCPASLEIPLKNYLLMVVFGVIWAFAAEGLGSYASLAESDYRLLPAGVLYFYSCVITGLRY